MTNAITLTLELNKKSYQIKCSEDDREGLEQAAAHLNAQLESIKEQTNNTIAGERLAILTALNISHDLQKSQLDLANQKNNSDALERITASITEELKLLSSVKE